jgi:hypothetical protein
MVVTEAIAGLGAIKTAFDMAKALENIHEAVARDRAVIDLQREILAAQQAQFALVDRLRDLEKELAKFEDWETEKTRYYLRDYGGATLAYELKGAPPGGEPPHRICPACYQNRKKGLLQSRGLNAYRQEIVKCTGCDKELELGSRVERNFSARARTDFDPFTGR